MKRAGRGWEADNVPLQKDAEVGGMLFFFFFQSGSFFSQVSSSICKVSKGRRSSTWRTTWGSRGGGPVMEEGLGSLGVGGGWGAVPMVEGGRDCYSVTFS